MKAVRVIDPGPESRLRIGEVEKPEPAENELLVRVRATALNRADLLQRAGKYAPPPGTSEILGLEMAGEVESWGKACTGWEKDDPVCGLLPGGGYAEYVTIPESLAIRMLPGQSFEQAAAIPEVFLTAYQALYWLGDLKAGESVLIHAGASGVGTAGIQLARAIHNKVSSQIFVTASAAKHAACLTLGADHAIDYKKEDFAAVLKEKTAGKGVDLVIDFIGAPYFKKNIDSLGLDGRLVILAMMGGPVVESVNLMQLFRKRIHVKTSTLRSRSVDYKARLTADLVDNCMPLFNSGELKPVIDKIVDWQDVEEAHNYMASNQNTGKIVLQVS